MKSWKTSFEQMLDNLNNVSNEESAKAIHKAILEYNMMRILSNYRSNSNIIEKDSFPKPFFDKQVIQLYCEYTNNILRYCDYRKKPKISEYEIRVLGNTVTDFLKHIIETYGGTDKMYTIEEYCCILHLFSWYQGFIFKRFKKSTKEQIYGIIKKTYNTSISPKEYDKYIDNFVAERFEKPYYYQVEV